MDTEGTDAHTEATLRPHFASLQAAPGEQGRHVVPRPLMSKIPPTIDSFSHRLLPPLRSSDRLVRSLGWLVLLIGLCIWAVLTCAGYLQYLPRK